MFEGVFFFDSGIFYLQWHPGCRNLSTVAFSTALSNLVAAMVERRSKMGKNLRARGSGSQNSGTRTIICVELRRGLMV